MHNYTLSHNLYNQGRLILFYEIAKSKFLNSQIKGFLPLKNTYINPSMYSPKRASGQD